jgi:hypothetical protein
VPWDPPEQFKSKVKIITRMKLFSLLFGAVLKALMECFPNENHSLHATSLLKKLVLLL